MDCTVLPSLNTIADQQANPTQNTESAITHFMDYSGTNPTPIVQYKSSDKLIHIASYALHLSRPWACSRTGGNYYLRSLPYDPTKAPNLPHPENIEYRILRDVVAYESEAEVRGIYHNGKPAVPLHITLNEISFP